MFYQLPFRITPLKLDKCPAFRAIRVACTILLLANNSLYAWMYHKLIIIHEFLCNKPVYCPWVIIKLQWTIYSIEQLTSLQNEKFSLEIIIALFVDKLFLVMYINKIIWTIMHVNICRYVQSLHCNYTSFII